jgi:anti-sigma factor RsiW
MSHLGELLSALVDGELGGAELDRANAHLASCDDCQAEASSLRQLKLELRALAEACDCDGITRRLLAITGEEGLAVPVSARPVERTRGGYRPRARGRSPGGRGATSGPYAGRPRSQAPGRRRGRYMLWGTVSLVVVGIGTAAFGMGGGSGTPGPRITPQVEVFDVEHAITSGDVPFADLTDPKDPANPADPADSAVRSARLPAVAARP